MNSGPYTSPNFLTPLPNNTPILASSTGGLAHTSDQSHNSAYHTLSWHQYPEYQAYGPLGIHPPLALPQPPIPPLRSNETIGEFTAENTGMSVQALASASASGEDQMDVDENGEGADAEGTIKH